MTITNLNPDAVRELRQILESYHLGAKIENISSLSRSTASSSVFCARLENGEKYVIRQSSWYDFAPEKAMGALEKAYEVSEKLREHGLPIGKAFRNNNDKFVTRYNNENFVVLEFLEGNRFNYSDKELEESGKALGLFHRLGREVLRSHKDLENEIMREIPVEKPYEESCKMYFNGLRDDLLHVHKCEHASVCQAVRENIKTIDSTIDFVDNSGLEETKSRGLLHNDFNIENGVYDSNGSFAGFLDIDQMGLGSHVLDVGNSLTSFTYKLWQTSPQEVERKAALFLRAYHKEFPLDAGEYLMILAATQRWDVMRILRTMRRHIHEDNRLPALLPKVTDRLLPRIALAPKIYGFLTDEWLER